MSTIPRQGKKALEPLRPEKATVVDVIRETHNIKSLRVVFDDEELMTSFTFQPGQVGQLGVMGAGESTFAIASPPSQREYIQFSVMKTGVVTTAIHELAVGDRVTVRAPMGNHFPVDRWQGKNVLVIGGGIGMAPLRSLFLHMMDHREEYGHLQLIYGARTPSDICYRDDCRDWKQCGDVDFITTIDTGNQDWEGRVGLVPAVLEEEEPSPENNIAVTCGPPVMIKFVLESLGKMGFRDEQIYTTLERRMKCGIGLCGRCNVGPRYVCTDGPVFSLKELGELPDEM
ncbi:anaerobic sulfite reductase subunit B [bacterium BMS3Abin01]|nr:anaerobic sulfite reductase subunit B [bacterium BMS3Abin01]